MSEEKTDLQCLVCEKGMMIKVIELDEAGETNISYHCDSCGIPCIYIPVRRHATENPEKQATREQAERNRISLLTRDDPI
jgi:hypothetical protein